MSFLVLPTAYLGGCVATMSVFSYIYRRATSMSLCLFICSLTRPHSKIRRRCQGD